MILTCCIASLWIIPRASTTSSRLPHSWLSVLPDEGSWNLGRKWLDPAENLNPQDHSTLLTAAVTAMARSIRSEQGFTSEDGNRLVWLAGTTLRDHPDATPRSSELLDSGVNTRATVVQLWRIAGFVPEACCLFVAETAISVLVATAARRVAVELVALQVMSLLGWSS